MLALACKSLQVGAIRVSAEDQQEAQMEEEDGNSLARLEEEVYGSIFSITQSLK